MKYWILLSLVLIACSQVESNEVPENVMGSYKEKISIEFSSDTILSKCDEGYLIQTNSPAGETTEYYTEEGVLTNSSEYNNCEVLK